MEKPIHIFSDAAEFARRHRAGTSLEAAYEKREIEIFNAKKILFNSWVISMLGENKARKQQYWLFLVLPGDKVEWRFPREGDSCKLQLYSKSGAQSRSMLWEAERIENPCSLLGLLEDDFDKYAAFRVVVPDNDGSKVLKPLLKSDDQTEISLMTGRATKMRFELSYSSATSRAELEALDRLTAATSGCNEKQRNAFRYLMDFKNPASVVSLFDSFPWMAKPRFGEFKLPARVTSLYHRLNDGQRIAYRKLLSSLPCGIGILPGGPGAGKTHWNLTVSALAHAGCLERPTHGWISESNERSVKILYLLDINKPLSDSTNKLVRLYQAIGLKKRILRLYHWNYERDTKKVGGSPNFSRGFLTIARLRRRRSGRRAGQCLAPTIDEAAYDLFEEHRDDKYKALDELLGQFFAKNKKKDYDANSSILASMCGMLYRDLLIETDFIATTPVAASHRFSSMFSPDIIFFDESPHARELSTLIAIANYSPAAWILSGDHRQTRPFLATDDPRENKWAAQMLVSTMERAFVANAIQHQLLVNHRAHGGLERLASTLFYNSEMVAFDSNPTVPSTVEHLKEQYLDSLLSCNARVGVPRLIVHIQGARATQHGTSWANHDHLECVMDLVSELVADPNFRYVSSDKIERGSILIISPYKEAVIRYRGAIRQLGQENRVDVRTIDTVQGHEADFVFVDFVRDRASQFLDDPNRLCVALTRARQAELLIMHPGLAMTTTGFYSRHLKRILDEYSRIGQLACLGRTAAVPKKHLPEGEVFEMMALRLDQATLAAAAEWIASGQKPTARLAGKQIASQVRQVSTETQEEIDRQNDEEEEGVERTGKDGKGTAQLPALRTVAVRGFNTPLDGGQSWW